jgi:tyrosine-protein phosphatase YwqE
VQADPRRLAPIIEQGAFVQITAASLDGRIGDAHTPDIREVGLADAVEALADDELASYLTERAPATIVAGEALPPPPKRKRRRRFLWR